MRIGRSILTAVVSVAFAGAAFGEIDNQTLTLQANQHLNLVTGAASASGGDITFTGSSITFIGSAKGSGIPGGGSTVFNNFTQQMLQTIATMFTTNPIGFLAEDTVIAMETNGGNYAKILITSVSSSSVSITFTTFGSTSGAPGKPTIIDIQNNSSTIPAGFTNSGIAPSTLFVIHGTGMAAPGSTPVLQDCTHSLPTTLNGASLTVSAGGKTFTPPIWYSSPTQIAAILPAAVPTGSATITVSYNGTTSAALTFQVVPSAYGISVYNGNSAVLQDAMSPTGALITPMNSAKPGQIVTLWGTGLGANPADSDGTLIQSPHAISTPVQIYVGGVPATLSYAGGTAYPSVHVVIFTIPAGTPTGCAVPLAIVTHGNMLSNTPVAAIMPDGGVCQDALTGLDGKKFMQFKGQGTVRFASLMVGQATTPEDDGPQTMDIAVGNFQSLTGSLYGTPSPAIGSCWVTEATGTPSSSAGLDAGTITVTGPSGSKVTLRPSPAFRGEYFAQLGANAIPLSGGTFTFDGSGGADVGPLTTTVNFSNPILAWTNQSASSSVARSSGQTFKWTGGAPGTFVIMNGSSQGNGVSGSYSCIAPVAAGQFAVPPYIMYALPAGTGTTLVENMTMYTPFTALNLDIGFAIGYVAYVVDSTFN